MRVDLLVSEVQGHELHDVQLIDLFSADELNDFMNVGLRPAPAPASPREAQEAQRLMKLVEDHNLPGLPDRTDTPTIPHPLLGITAEPTIIESPIEPLIREMKGWRRHEIPGGWVLDILPRSCPVGWEMRADVIQKKAFLDFEDIDHARLFCGYFGGVPNVEPYLSKETVAWHERIGIPRWLVEERERSARTVGTFAEQFEQEPVSCPDGHRLTGKSQTI